MRDFPWTEQISSCWDFVKTAEGLCLSHRLSHGIASLEELRQSVTSGTVA